MTIKEGYDGKSTHIKIYARTDIPERKAEVWLEQEGLPNYRRAMAGEDGTYVSTDTHSETLAYATLDEILALRDECNAAIQELVK